MVECVLISVNYGLCRVNSPVMASRPACRSGSLGMDTGGTAGGGDERGEFFIDISNHNRFGLYFMCVQ